MYSCKQNKFTEKINVISQIYAKGRFPLDIISIDYHRNFCRPDSVFIVNCQLLIVNCQFADCSFILFDNVFYVTALY